MGTIWLLLNSENPLKLSRPHGSETLDQCYIGSQEIATCSRARALSVALCRVPKAMVLVYGPALFSFWFSYTQCLATHTSLSLVFRLCRRGKQTRNEANVPACHREHTEVVIAKTPFPPAFLSTSRVSPENLPKSCYLRCFDKKQVVWISVYRRKPLFNCNALNFVRTIARLTPFVHHRLDDKERHSQLRDTVFKLGYPWNSLTSPHSNKYTGLSHRFPGLIITVLQQWNCGLFCPIS